MLFALIRGVAQLASALAWGARGRTFKSYHPDDQKRSEFSHSSFFLITGMKSPHSQHCILHLNHLRKILTTRQSLCLCSQKNVITCRILSTKKQAGCFGIKIDGLYHRIKQNKIKK